MSRTENEKSITARDRIVRQLLARYRLTGDVNIIVLLRRLTNWEHDNGQKTAIHP